MQNRFIFFNELSLPVLMWQILLRRQIYLITMPSVYTPLGPFMERIESWLIRHGICHSIYDLDATLGEYKEVRMPRHVDDTFSSIEGWMEKHFMFETAKKRLGEDAMPYKQVSCNFIFSYFAPLLLLRHLSLNYADGTNVALGADLLLVGFYRDHYGEEPRLTVKKVGPWRILVNLLTVGVSSTFAIFDVIRNLRLGHKQVEHMLGCDYITHLDLTLWNELDPDKTRILVVFRNKAFRRGHREKIEGFPSVWLGDGPVPLSEALGFLGRTLGALARISRHFLSIEPGLLSRTALIPLKRLIVLRLLAGHRFKYFLGRDDYNVEHILRSQELRKRGGVSIGVIHGIPVTSILMPMWRYVDFDIYYVLGRRLYEAYYLDKWSDHITIKPTYCMAMTRRLHALAKMPPPGDILFQLKPWRNIDPFIEAVRSLAAAFPEKTIYVQIKPSFRSNFLARRFIDEGCRNFSNIELTEESPYKLFLKARYQITDPSTVGPEALQFGLYSFILDVYGQKSLFFRDFKDYCIKTGDEAVRRIRGIEDGSYHYPRETYEGLATMKGKLYYDAIREDLGLPPFMNDDQPATDERKALNT